VVEVEVVINANNNTGEGPGGSGGGAGAWSAGTGTGGAGNTPPAPASQGNPGGGGGPGGAPFAWLVEGVVQVNLDLQTQVAALVVLEVLDHCVIFYHRIISNLCRRWWRRNLWSWILVVQVVLVVVEPDLMAHRLVEHRWFRWFRHRSRPLPNRIPHSNRKGNWWFD
jgi:hypothetical protein